MTPDWLQPMPWLEMSREKEREQPGLVGTIANSGMDLFDAWQARKQRNAMQDRKPQIMNTLLHEAGHGTGI